MQCPGYPYNEGAGQRRSDRAKEEAQLVSAVTRKDKAPEVVERFLKALIVANKAVGLYPPSSTIPRDTSEAAATILREALQQRSELVLGVAKEGMTFDGEVVVPGRSAYTDFALELYNRRLADVRFHVGATGQDVLSFLSVLRHSPDEIDAVGGFESRLWDQNVTAITVTAVRVTIVEASPQHSTGESARLTRTQIDTALGLTRGAKRDRYVLARFLDEPAAVADYLGDLFEETESVQQVAARFALLAAAREIGGGSDDSVPKNLAAALTLMDESLRTGILLHEILPESRANKHVAAVLRQLDVDGLFRMVVAGVDPGDPPIAVLARAVRHVGALLAGSPGDIETAARAAMRGAGLSDEDVSRVLGAARPETVTVTQQQPVTDDAGVAHVVTHAFEPLSDEELDTLPELGALRMEVARGVTDGDVALALTMLIAAGCLPHHFDSTMKSLEAALDLMIERDELEAAADVAEALNAVARDPRCTDDQRLRLEAAIGHLAKTSDVKSIVGALRAGAANETRRATAARVLDSLGSRAIEPMLDLLADEQDMAGRKSLIDLLSEMAPRHIAEVGRHAADPRWYVVRNVVSILGATRSSAAIPYLERTLRNPEARVRRETVRALANINDRFAHQMLVAALTDEDPQNVQLAARYLGSAKVDIAIPALERVARGEGFGNRDPGPRVEAIEALGRMGAVSALPTLEALAGRRSLLQATKVRELRAAAVSAVARIKSAGGAA